MSHLNKLTLTNNSPRQALSPLERKRKKLIEQLDQQFAAANQVNKGEPATRAVQRWVRPDGGGQKELVTKIVPVRKWWWTDGAGKVMLSLRLGNHLMDIAPGKTAIEVGTMLHLPDVLQTVREAVEAGELDEQIAPDAPTKQAKKK